MLQVWALVRSAFQNRGKFYTQMATSIRCVRPGKSTITSSAHPSNLTYGVQNEIDQWSKTITVHYLSSGSANLRVSIKKQV
jgi:hypothetical protein